MWVISLTVEFNIPINNKRWITQLVKYRKTTEIDLEELPNEINVDSLLYDTMVVIFPTKCEKYTF